MASGDDVTILVIETGLPIPFTVANATAIAKGDILQLTDPMTASLVSGDGQAVAGIAAEDKIANDGRTSIGVYREGIFTGEAGVSTIVVGESLDTHNSGGTNEIADAPVTTGARLGYALETPGDSDRFLFELKPHWQSANS